MKIGMAKASENDIQAATELHQILDLIDERFGGPHPISDVGDSLADVLSDEDFDSDNEIHLQALYNNLAKLLRTTPNFHGRVIGGFCYVIMYDKNEIVDPDSDTLDLHPRFKEMWNDLQRETQAARYWNMRYHQVAEERDQLQMAYANPLQKLKAYQVGDNDIVAAYDEAGAIKVLTDFCGYPEEEFTIDDVELVSDALLDNLEVWDQDEGKKVTLDKSLRQDLAELTEPTYMYGWE